MACGGNCAQCTGASCVANKGIIEAERAAQKAAQAAKEAAAKAKAAKEAQQAKKGE